jgi:hypothetical protein
MCVEMEMEDLSQSNAFLEMVDFVENQDFGEGN